MDQKLAATVAIAMLIATVGAYSSSTAANSTLNNTAPGNTTSSPATAPLHQLHAHRIVCVGDSITEGFADPDNWPYHLKTRLDGDWEVVDQGVGGAFTADMLDRIDAALELNPHFVIVMGGLNDLTNGEPLDATKVNIAAMCTRVEAYGAVPVLCTVTPTSERLAQHDALNAWIKEYARLNGYDVIDFYAVINNKSNPGYSDPALVFSDGKHPTPAGYAAMGNAIDLAIFTRDKDAPQQSTATSTNEASSVFTSNT